VKVRLLFLLLWSAVSAAAEAPVPLSAYGELPALEYPKLSPDGKHLGLVVRAQGQRILLVLDEHSKPVIQAPLGEVKLRDLQWAGNDYLLAITSATYQFFSAVGDDQELDNIVLFNLDTGKASWPMNDARYVSAVLKIYPAVQRDGQWMLPVESLPKAGNLINGEGAGLGRKELTLIHLDSGRLQRLEQPLSDVSGWLLDPQGRIVAKETYNDVSRQWQLHSPSAEGGVLVSQKDIYGTSSVVGLGSVPGTVVYVRSDGHGAVNYSQQALDGKSDATDIFPQQQVSEWQLDDLDGHVIGARLGGVDPVLFLLDPDKQKLIEQIRSLFPHSRTHIVSFDHALDAAIVMTEGAGDAGTYWRVDTDKMRASRLGSQYPSIPANAIGERQWFQYKAADGLALDGVLTLPAGEKPASLPVIVLPHGGPQWHDELKFDWWAEAFASRGYAVWQPNFRGSNGYGAAFRDAGMGQWGRKMQTDVSDGLAALAAAGIVDTGRACIVGASYGGYVALAGVTVQQGLYRCAVSVGGVSDPADLIRRVDDIRTGQLHAVARYWKAYMGASSWNDPIFDAISPVRLARQADAPVLLIHGKDDTVVPIDQSREMAQALNSAGHVASLVELDGEDHWLSRSATRQQMLETTMTFVEKYNPANAPDVKGP